MNMIGYMNDISITRLVDTSDVRITWSIHVNKYNYGVRIERILQLGKM